LGKLEYHFGYHYFQVHSGVVTAESDPAMDQAVSLERQTEFFSHRNPYSCTYKQRIGCRLT